MRAAQGWARPLVPLLLLSGLLYVALMLSLVDTVARPRRSEDFYAVREAFQRSAGIGLAAILVGLVAGAVWVAWFYYLYRAAAALGPVRYPVTWTWLWAWLVPWVSLFVPKQLVNDVWRVATDDRQGIPPRAVQMWWALWVVAGGTRVVPDRLTGELGRVLTLIAAAAMVLAVPFAILTVRRLTEQLQERYDESQAAQEAAAGLPAGAHAGE